MVIPTLKKGTVKLSILGHTLKIYARTSIEKGVEFICPNTDVDP